MIVHAEFYRDFTRRRGGHGELRKDNRLNHTEEQGEQRNFRRPLFPLFLCVRLPLLFSVCSPHLLREPIFEAGVHNHLGYLV